MSTLLLVALFALPLSFLSVPLFETLFAIVLITPILAFLLAQLLGLSAPTYLLALAILGAALTLVVKRTGRSWRRPSLAEAQPVIVWAVAYLFFLILAFRWPDFIAIGERLRDYSLLTSVVKSPLVPLEYWMAGSSLNYYLYWYRFGHFLHSLAHLPVWAVYHQLQCFTMALYVAALFRIFTTVLKVKPSLAVFFAAIIAIGSNIAGIGNFLRNDRNWWGPSRVIPGAIDEFPAWSFLLGDLHPHFLNLPLTPFLLLLTLSLGIPALLRLGSRWLRAVALVAGVLGVFLWTYNANAWEVAPLAIMVVPPTVLLFRPLLLARPGSEGQRASLVTIAFLGVAVIAVVSLYLSSRNITPLSTPLRFVRMPLGLNIIEGPVLAAAALLKINLQPSVSVAVGTSVLDFLGHFGLPVAIISLGAALLLSTVVERALAVVVLVIVVLSGATLPLLMVVTGLVMSALVSARVLEGGDSAALARRAVWGFGIGALLAVIFPEVIFFDDPYGGENERMNTIFKFYSATWGILHLFAFALSLEVARRYHPIFRRVPRPLSIAATVIVGWLMCGFFFATISDRSNKNLVLRPYWRGLSTVDRDFRGSATIIQRLNELPEGVVIEAPGNPYSYTTFVSTLGEKPAFLGWANHMNLLLHNSPEVGRREKVLRDFYGEMTCDERRAIATKEGVRYVVFGSLEKRVNSQLTEGDFACFREVASDREYRLYEVG